jgi:hypothetical protein
MLKTVHGVYRNGEVALEEAPNDVQDGTPVLVTFLAATPIHLEDVGINPAAAAELRASLSSFAAEWDSSAMDIYDDYDAARSRLQAR